MWGRWTIYRPIAMLCDFQAFQLAKDFHIACRKLKLPLFLKEQLLRASSSVALNIAEGSGKWTEKDQKRFYSISYGSLRECEAILEIEELNSPEIRQLVNRLGKMLFALSKPNAKPGLTAKHQTTNTKRPTESSAE